MRLRALMPPRRLPRRVALRRPSPNLRGAAVALFLFASLLAGSAFGSSRSPVPAMELALPSLPTTAEAEGVIEDDEPQLRARLLVSSGSEQRVGVLFDLEPGWHLYWRNPGGTGIAPRLDLSVPGHEIGDVAWPAPQTFEEADGLFTTWGYEGSVLLSVATVPTVPIEAVAGKSAAPSPIEAHPKVLVCRTQCVPAEFSLSFPVDARLGSADQARVDALFEDALRQLPVHADSLGVAAQANWKAGSPATDQLGEIELTVDTCGGRRTGSADADPQRAACPALAEGAGSALFIPMEGETFEYEQARRIGDPGDAGRFVMSVAATRLEEGADRLWGLIPVRDDQGRLQYLEIDVAIGASTNAALPGITTTEAAPPSWTRWTQIFFLALLGGFILNGMPCVLPVLAIKVFAVADMAEKDPREVRLHGLAYTGGVLGSMAILSAIVLGLRSAGHSVGWGFQFQEPLFVAAISAILVTFALNLFGIFEIELGQGKLATVGGEATGLRRSAFEGLLAVILATPCTAPFLGTAVGFAFASSGFGIAAIFLAIGLGLASPFLAVSFVPSFARFIPRSGPWMNTFRSGLGFALLATVVWLLWILGQSGGASAVVSMTGVLLFLAFLLWTFGQFQPVRRVWLGRVSVVAIAGLAFAGFNLIEFDRADPAPGASESIELAEGWREYSPEAVAQSLAEGDPAFVVFTADWCITCKLNERTVLERAAIRDALSDRDYALFKADWTRRDESIRLKLAEFGRAGVPLYLVYRPERPEDPIVLSELLSQKEVLAALGEPGAPRAI